jgi:hypothetical protein
MELFWIFFGEFSWICFEFGLDIFWVCFGIVSELFWICFGIVLKLSGIVQELFWICLGFVLDLFSICFGFVLDLFGFVLELDESVFETLSTPDLKIFYPEPFIASPSFVHEDL